MQNKHFSLGGPATAREGQIKEVEKRTVIFHVMITILVFTASKGSSTFEFYFGEYFQSIRILFKHCPTYIVKLRPSWISMVYLIFFIAAGWTNWEKLARSSTLQFDYWPADIPKTLKFGHIGVCLSWLNIDKCGHWVTYLLHLQKCTTFGISPD